LLFQRGVPGGWRLVDSTMLCSFLA
jgi:hypothetical protein